MFHKTGPVEGSYADGRGGVSGKYQGGDDLDELIASWRPEMLLPKTFKDQRVNPQVVHGLTKGMK